MELMGYALRAIVIYLFTYFAARILPGKAIAQMTVYELTGLFLISTVAAEPLVTKVTAKALVGIALILGMIILTSRLSLINRITPWFEHTPTIIINKGKIDYKALKGSFLSLNQLQGLLRQKGYDKISDIEYAILEPQGELSVFVKTQKRPVQVADLAIDAKEEGLTFPLIMDGQIIRGNLRHLNLSTEWLIQELAKQGITNYKNQVFLAEIDASSRLSVFHKERF
ncbi:MAG: hypothetical protein AWM53_01419 [Candidatus Dichloromethanomonas elyunquensis]|nr:MAG: hypothetical protein AWM53_01419 [Candidatus Dichloromethanomonas elyunquensis]